MRRTCQRIGVVAAATVLFGCDGPANPSPPDPRDPPPPVGNTWTTPAIRGLVRETNGGPIAGAKIRIGEWNRFVEVESNQEGLFAFPEAAVECRSVPSSAHVALSISSLGFHIQDGNVVPCSKSLNPPVFESQVRGQRVLVAQVGVPIDTALSNEDFDWRNPTDPEDYPCGPCRHVFLKLPRGNTTQLRVEWSGPAPLRVWLSGDVDWDRTHRLGEFEAAPGESAVAVTIPSDWQALFPFVKIGLPYGHRHPGLADPVAIRLELRTVSQ